MSEHAPSECRKCGGQIFWHKAKSGKSYPTNSADDRRDFHNCDAPVQPAPAKPPRLEATVEERLTDAERMLTSLLRRVAKLEQAGPITSDDVPF